MITTLEIEGFKSFVAESLEFRELTVLTGLNSSGKSSVIQSLLMLEKATRNEPYLLAGHGNIPELKNRYSDKVILNAELDNGNSIRIVEGDNNSSANGFPELIYICADRHGPETSVPIYADSYKMGKRGENIFNCIEHYADRVIPERLRHPNSEGDTLLFNLRAWLGVISPNVDFKSNIESMIDSSFATFNGYRAKNVGFGLSYTLPVIVAVLLGSVLENTLVIIENPEAHVHPRGQVELAKLISMSVISGANVLVETHSDHLFDGIRIQAKNNSDFSSKIILYWFELDKNGNTSVEYSDVDKMGRLSNSPQGLFDQFGINAGKLI